MSWLKKLWRGEAKFWQGFWLGLFILIASTAALGIYVGESLQAGKMSFEDFHYISGYYQVIVLIFCALWLMVLARSMHRAVWSWSAWLAVVFVIYTIGTSTYNLTLFALHDGDSPVVFMQEGGDEGV